MNPRRSDSESPYYLPQLWIIQRASDCHISSVVSENSGQSPQWKSKVVQKTNGRDFDEFSTNIFCIYIYGQGRQYLPKNIVIYFCSKESIAPF